MDILRSGIFQVDGVDQGRDLFIFCHAWDGCDIFDTGMVRGFIPPDCLLCFKEPGPGGYSDGF